VERVEPVLGPGAGERPVTVEQLGEPIDIAGGAGVEHVELGSGRQQEVGHVLPTGVQGGAYS